MSRYINQRGAGCCGSSVPGLRTLTFPDGSKAGVTGLDEIFEDSYREGKIPDTETASEIVNRLEGKNYIASTVRKRYHDVVLEEYQKFYESKIRRENTILKKETKQNERKKDFSPDYLMGVETEKARLESSNREAW